MVSEKQLEANRRNALKGGVKTQEGKAVVKYNALKHGLLAKEVVIAVGDGAEDTEEFSALLMDLRTSLNPAGTIEEILVEKIAVAYWRFRRARRYETGLIGNRIDTIVEDYYNKTDWSGKKMNRTEEEIQQEIEELGEIQSLKKHVKDLKRAYEEGKSLEEIYNWLDGWFWLYLKLDGKGIVGDEDFGPLNPCGLREFLSNLGWTDDHIWENLIKSCDEAIEEYERSVAALERQKEKNRLKLQTIKKLYNIPSKEELERLLRYEGAIERQFYKALNQLERMQRLRLGDNIPAPIEVDVSIDKTD